MWFLKSVLVPSAFGLGRDRIYLAKAILNMYLHRQGENRTEWVGVNLNIFAFFFFFFCLQVHSFLALGSQLTS